MMSKVSDLSFFLEPQMAISSGCLSIFSPITFKEAKTDTANSGVKPLMKNTKHKTVQNSVLVDMQNNFMGNPYNVDNTHSPSTGSDQIILLL